MSVPKTMSWVFNISFVMLFLAMALVAIDRHKPAGGQAERPPTDASSRDQTDASGVVEKHELTSVDIESFLDGLIPLQLRTHDIAGAAIAVVKDGRILFAKGYGYSDLEKRVPVSAGDTLFRLGSVSKLFIWTAVMQQVEQGRIELDRDINEYLDFRIPLAYGAPVTMRDLMTHTAGFEEVGKDNMVPGGTQLQSLRDYLRTHIPARIFPPGQTVAYSNYGSNLAAYVVQRVSGEPFNQYARNHIFMPLGMMHSTFAQPLPPELAPLLSKGYRAASHGPRDFEWLQTSGNLSSSAQDMCSFMIAHLRNGKFGNSQILQPQTAELMHARQFAPGGPNTDAMAFGFWEESRNGRRIIGHGGDTRLFHTKLHLILDADVGLFTVINSRGNGRGHHAELLVFDQFLDRYFPYKIPAAPKMANPQSDANQVAGSYLTTRRAERSFLRIMGLQDQMAVVPRGDGRISIEHINALTGEPKQFEEIGPLLYREINGQDKVEFHRNANHQLEFSEDWPVWVYQRVGFWDNKNVNYWIILPSLILMALAILAWPYLALVRWWYGASIPSKPRDKLLLVLTRLVCLIDLGFLLGIYQLLAKTEVPEHFGPNLDPWIISLQLVGWVGMLGTVILILNAVSSCQDKARWIGTKTADVTLAMSAIAFTWFVWHWNLVNFVLHF